MFINFSNHPYAQWSAEQQAAAQRALSAHGSDAPRLPDGQFVQRHIRFPHCSKYKMLA